ncbi:unnamed protein product [Acanthoscelides obtectus]|uniref:PiggyBac transposable element-derived protein domain-containing protein n=1 Tax=Acanthoscelides obtectus TaxID=200917 RepID=A0A9P0PHB3_ACAOB|nr:unnamed protein product [Acanthoscelides obtectus]CAK1681827.1 hypothetical protein AOBTE_LOCUS33294 [Acanthoscelides obtectus]
MTIVNAWLLYRRVLIGRKIQKTLGLANFRIDLGETLCKIGIRQNSRGRKSDLEKKIQQKRRSRRYGLTRAHTGPYGCKNVYVVNFPSAVGLRTSCVKNAKPRCALTKLKSRKWYFRLFYYHLDMTIVNAWLLYRRVMIGRKIQKTLGLANFRIDLGETLCKIGIRQNSRGRKSDLEKKIQQKRRSRRYGLTRAHTGPYGCKNVYVVNFPSAVGLRTSCVKNAKPRCALTKVKTVFMISINKMLKAYSRKLCHISVIYQTV